MKNKQRRVIPLGAFGSYVLATYRRHQVEIWGEDLGEWVLSYVNVQTPLSARVVTDHFASLAKRVGIKATFHDLRHFHQSAQLAGGIDVVTAARRAGHIPEVILSVYAHGTPERGAASAEVVSDILTAAIPQCHVGQRGAKNLAHEDFCTKVSPKMSTASSYSRLGKQGRAEATVNGFGRHRAHGDKSGEATWTTTTGLPVQSLWALKGAAGPCVLLARTRATRPSATQRGMEGVPSRRAGLDPPISLDRRPRRGRRASYTTPPSLTTRLGSLPYRSSTAPPRPRP